MLSGRIQFEGQVSERLAISGVYTGYSVKSKQYLEPGNQEPNYYEDSIFGPSRDVVRVGDTYFQAPETVSHRVDIRRASLDVKAFPINNNVAQFYVGGGLRFLDVSLNMSGEGRQGEDSGENVGLGPVVGVYFPIQSSFAASLNFSSHIARETSTKGHYFTGALHWLPAKAVQLDLGIFKDNYDIEEEINASWQYVSYKDCDIELNSNGCPSERNGESDLNIDAVGIFAGLTLRF